MTSEAEPQDQNSVDRDQLIDSICDDFEAYYTAGERPQIEDFLQRIDGPHKQRLLIELIAIDMHHRRRRGETISAAEYQTRFPGLSTARREATMMALLLDDLCRRLKSAAKLRQPR